jgi:hypothetical protein
MFSLSALWPVDDGNSNKNRTRRPFDAYDVRKDGRQGEVGIRDGHDISDSQRG